MDSSVSELSDQDVSRETIDRLEVFASLLKKWNPKINLVSRNSLSDLWSRHIKDSIQVFRSVKADGHWVDLGSGGGFPGAVVAILAAEETPQLRVTLVESDQRKSAFLRTVIRETGVSCLVQAQRIESIPPMQANILSARALADLPTLLEFAERHLGNGGIGLFSKGVTWEKELEAAREQWHFEATPVPSLTEPNAVILKIEGLTRG